MRFLRNRSSSSISYVLEIRETVAKSYYYYQEGSFSPDVVKGLQKMELTPNRAYATGIFINDELTPIYIFDTAPLVQPIHVVIKVADRTPEVISEAKHGIIQYKVGPTDGRTIEVRFSVQRQK